MKSIFVLILSLVVSVFSIFAQGKELTKGDITFHSITKSGFQASSTTFKSKLDLANNSVELIIPIQSFKFKTDAQNKEFISEENFNLINFPNVLISAKITSGSSIETEGRHIIEITGKATIKGKTQPFKTNGLLVNKDGVSTIKSSFLLNGKKIELKKEELSQIEVSISIAY